MFFRYPCFSTVRTLLYCGADVNAINSLWDTPLHVFATNTHGFKALILDFLFLAKADFYSVNVLNEMPIHLVIDSTVKQLFKSKMKINLKCLCARTIRMNHISYHGMIPQSLVTFLERH